MARAPLLRFRYRADGCINIHLKCNPLGRIESGVNLVLTRLGTAYVQPHAAKNLLQAKTSQKLGFMFRGRRILGLAWLLFLLHG
jgi:hypothetical protein